MSLQNACDELVEKIRSGKITSQRALEIEKVRISKKYTLGRILKNADILGFTSDEKIRAFLLTKPTRTLSGVANIAVMWMDKKSCIGSCIYCPQGINNKAKIYAEGIRLVPKSYTGSEPATMRALRLNYDPYMQVQNRLKQLKAIGHSTDKCELIIMGGTFLVTSEKYQKRFVQSCLDAFNKSSSRTLLEAQRKNESAANRCIGLTIETRADYCRKDHIKQMLRLGCTRVELGVQSTDASILKKIKRGHGIKENISAIRLLKEAGLKVCIHWMPGLTGLKKLDIKKELCLFRKLLSSPDYRPDELKIYPTLVIPGTELHELWDNDEYNAMTSDQAGDLLIKIKSLVPPYVRIKRVMRDISEKEVAAGPYTTNLRQLTQTKMAKLGISCRCIRCREVGLGSKKPEAMCLKKIQYRASGGKEIFLSYEDSKNNILLAFLRLRIDKSSAKVRELHVYGPMIGIGKTGGYQHKGLGKQLLSNAELIAKKHGKKSIQITSGIGAREYYRKLGYKPEGFYMVKKI